MNIDALRWLKHFEGEEYLFFSNDYLQNNNYQGFKTFMAAGAKSVLKSDGSNMFNKVKEFLNGKSHVFGYFGYDLKNETEDLQSKNKAGILFPDAFFFEPKTLVHWVNNEPVFISGKKVEPSVAEARKNKDIRPLKVTEGTSKEDYINTVKKIQNDIVEGDVYELNYCVDFYCDEAEIDPIELYDKLSRFSPTPFSTFMKLGALFIIGASPERFLKLSSGRLITQPIKGTTKRSQIESEDIALRMDLFNSEKERAENMMIVDLMRNDLNRSCQRGSVRVDELYGIYPFENLYHMISTVSGNLSAEVSPVDAIKNAFPVGSMTGAPKIRAMELIDQYETLRRGVFSGASGYFLPNGEFDFNVVIRSIFYDSDNRLLTYSVGSAITHDSVPEKEYEECLLKAEYLQKILLGI